MTVKRATKKPVTIEYAEYDGRNADEIAQWMDDRRGEFTAAATHGGELYIDTLEGQLHASPGDLIIRGVQGEFYPCKPDIFAATYDTLED